MKTATQILNEHGLPATCGALVAMDEYAKQNLKEELIKFWNTCEIDGKIKEKIINEYLKQRL